MSFLHGQEMINDNINIKWTYSVEKIDASHAYLVISAKIVSGYHIYSLKHNPADAKDTGKIPEFYFKAGSNYKLIGKPFETITPKKHLDIDIGTSYYFENNAMFKQKIEVLSKNVHEVALTLSFQICNETSCSDNTTSGIFKLIDFTPNQTATVTAADTSETVVSNIDSINPPKTKMETEKQIKIKKSKSSEPKKSMWLIFIISFLSGFAALLTPCVFPMIPMTVSFFTKKSKSKSEGIRNAILYGFSIIAIYVILGTIVTTIFGPSALNALSTNVWFNLLFFVLLVVFAISFLGAFEIMLPSSWLNKADKASDKGGFIGIFFMALALALVSFSCTGPIVGTLLVESATIGGIAPFVGMFGFSLALAIPFTLFAAFPGWMNALPKSGGWLNTVKVFLGFLELALAFKFLSNADLVVQGHFLERELFLAIWIGLFAVLTIYLFGFIRLPHDSPTEKLSVFRTLLASSCLVFVIYLIPGMWGAPLKLISGFPPPLSYSESPSGIGSSENTNSHSENNDMYLGPQNIMVFHDLEKAEAYAKEVHKPLFVNFTGLACIICRKMEEKVWGEPGIIEILRDKMVIVSLYVDEKTALPASELKELVYAPGKKMKITQIGQKWSYLQTTRYKSNTQPYYRLLGPQNEDLDIGSADYEHHGNATDFKAWLEKGLEEYKKADTKN